VGGVGVVGDTVAVETETTLETGYGPNTPSGDNLCNDYAAGMADGFLALAEARGDRVVADDPDVAIADSGSASLFGNFAILRRPIEAAAWPALTERIHEHFAGHRGGDFIVFSAWPTPDLRNDGFGRVGHPPLMFRPPGPLVSEPVGGLELRRVLDADTARDWESTLVRGYPLAQLDAGNAGLLPARALDAPRWQHWVGYLDGVPVATASAVVGDRHVDVEFISTLPEVRGRGVGRAATAAATLAAPDRPAMLVSSDEGRTVYERLGYLPLLRFTLWAGHRR
jgi:ribosomal protein S18 acetylase RimI-like enzyme